MTLTIENYNPHNREKIVSFVVRGDTKPYIENLRLLGGRRIANLSGGPGWLFSVRQHKDSVTRFVHDVNDELEHPYLYVALIMVVGFYLIGGPLSFLNQLLN